MRLLWIVRCDDLHFYASSVSEYERDNLGGRIRSLQRTHPDDDGRFSSRPALGQQAIEYSDKAYGAGIIGEFAVAVYSSNSISSKPNIAKDIRLILVQYDKGLPAGIPEIFSAGKKTTLL